MALSAGKLRQRAWKPKNRTGCKTCKIRKIKCDENKPHCKRCTSTGRTCDGYDVNFRPSHSPSQTPPPNNQGQPATNRELFRSVSPVPLAPALQLKTKQEQVSFDFFARYAVFSLQGFLDSSFWQREILQAAHQNESIQHCIIALGAMHRRFYEGSISHIRESDMADQYLQFALLQSNQAIKQLLKGRGPNGYMTGSDKVTLMTCCVLFSSMACLQGHQKEGMQHLRSGIRLLKDIDADQDQNLGRHPVDIDSLRSMFVGLDIQARSIMSTAEFETWEPPPHSKEPALSLKPDLDEETIVALQLRLQSVVNSVLAFLPATSRRSVDDWESVYCDYQGLLKRFNHTTEILDQLLIKASRTQGQYTQQLTAVQLLHCQLEYYLRCPRVDLADKFPFTWDNLNKPLDPTAQMARMLDLATQLLPHNSSLAPVFTTCMGPLSALWLIATRAPSECTAMRKRAVRLMLSSPRREGFWDSMVGGQIAAGVLKWEQETTQAELGLGTCPSRDLVVPDDLRIAAVMLAYDENDDRKATVEFQNARDLAMGRRGKMQIVVW
ncbi:hypothetical protein DE146DRAFT_641698 [Phaeosphaeria sp. MPI-PUGE-AT-0046c]|nr:hypothetical protein DE146DRAFT_641698 [Phaeosphaeria sp. MPI-PUGE-AT-0046c]